MKKQEKVLEFVGVGFLVLALATTLLGRASASGWDVVSDLVTGSIMIHLSLRFKVGRLEKQLQEKK